MEIEFDPGKDAVNVEKHDVSLEYGSNVFLDSRHLVLTTERAQDGERRSKAIGLVGDRLWTAIFVMRGEAYRFISMRRSNDGEERLYHSA